MKSSFALVALLVSLFASQTAAQAYSYPTPATTPAPYPSVTPAPTPSAAPTPLPTAYLCFQDYNVGPVVCGQDYSVPAGDAVVAGISMGQPINGVPQGPWPSTVTLIIQGSNTVTFAGVPVDQTTGSLGWATFPGIQAVTINLGGTATYSSAVQTLVTH